MLGKSVVCVQSVDSQSDYSVTWAFCLIFPYQAIKILHSDADHLLQEYLFWFHFMLNGCSFALLKHVCQWTSGMPATLSFPYFTEEGSRSFCWDMRAVHIGQLLCVCFQGHPLVMRDLRTPLELILFCLFSMWIKALFHQCLLFCAFLGDSDTKMPGTSIPGGYHCDDLCCFPCSWSPTLALVTSTWCSAQYKTLLQMYLKGRRR